MREKNSTCVAILDGLRTKTGKQNISTTTKRVAFTESHFLSLPDISFPSSAVLLNCGLWGSPQAGPSVLLSGIDRLLEL